MPREAVVDFCLLVRDEFGIVFTYLFSCRRRNKMVHAEALMFRRGWTRGADYTVTELETE